MNHLYHQCLICIKCVPFYISLLATNRHSIILCGLLSFPCLLHSFLLCIVLFVVCLKCSFRFLLKSFILAFQFAFFVSWSFRIASLPCLKSSDTPALPGLFQVALTHLYLKHLQSFHLALIFAWLGAQTGVQPVIKLFYLHCLVMVS